MVNDSSDAPLVDLPCPRAMADSIEVLERSTFLAFAMAAARRALKVGFGPPTADVQHICSAIWNLFPSRLDARAIS